LNDSKKRDSPKRKKHSPVLKTIGTRPGTSVVSHAICATQPAMTAAPAIRMTSDNHRAGQAISFIAVSPFAQRWPWRQPFPQYNPRRCEKLRKVTCDAHPFRKTRTRRFNEGARWTGLNTPWSMLGRRRRRRRSTFSSARRCTAV
jgi:hypothetical protein